MKRITEEMIREVEKIYCKSNRAEIEQAEVLLNNPEILAGYYENKEATE